MTSGQIEGKVAQILNERELVINIGTNSGVVTGAIFAVLAATPTEVRDPESSEVLGQIDRVKVQVRAFETHERFTVCSTYRTRIVGGLGPMNLDSVLSPRRQIPETLRASEDSFPEPLSPEESYVKVGDRVKQVLPVDLDED